MCNISRQREMIKILLSILFTCLFTYCIPVLFTLRAKKELWKHSGSPFNLPSAFCPLEKYCLVYSMHIIRFTFLSTRKADSSIPSTGLVLYLPSEISGYGICWVFVPGS